MFFGNPLAPHGDPVRSDFLGRSRMWPRFLKLFVPRDLDLGMGSLARCGGTYILRRKSWEHDDVSGWQPAYRWETIDRFDLAGRRRTTYGPTDYRFTVEQIVPGPFVSTTPQLNGNAVRVLGRCENRAVQSDLLAMLNFVGLTANYVYLMIYEEPVRWGFLDRLSSLGSSKDDTGRLISGAEDASLPPPGGPVTSPFALEPWTR